MDAEKAVFRTRDGAVKVVVPGDPLYCEMDQCRVRFLRMVDSSSVEVSADWDGKVLPDYRHPAHLWAY